VCQVRNSWLANPFHSAQPFLDKAQWEQMQRSGQTNISSWIDGQMTGTSVTVVLIGPETLGRKWVQYEIDKSLALGKGLLGVTLENIRQSNQSLDTWNRYTAYGPFQQPQQTHNIYSWIQDNGRANMAAWIETAARNAGR
jgi:hypothetical protein